MPGAKIRRTPWHFFPSVLASWISRGIGNVGWHVLSLIIRLKRDRIKFLKSIELTIIYDCYDYNSLLANMEEETRFSTISANLL